MQSVMLRRARRLALLALAGCALLAPVADARTTAVGVSAREFTLSLYRAEVKRGTVKFNLTNFGEDGHNLVVRRRGRTLASTEEVGPGGRGVLRVKLRKRGSYRLVCTIADHERLGMKATLRVR